MSLHSTVTSKGQVTVPVEIRRKLGLREGDRVEFAEQGNQTVIRRAPDPQNPLERDKGALKGMRGNRRAIRKWVAELRDDQESGG